jgi:hypothetical protein
MNALGYRKKLRLAGGRVHYQGLAWVKPEAQAVPNRSPPLKAALRHAGAHPAHGGIPGAPLSPN